MVGGRGGLGAGVPKNSKSEGSSRQNQAKPGGGVENGRKKRMVPTICIHAIYDLFRS